MIPKIEITNVGYKVPTTEQINAGVWSVLKSALGESISTVQGTPQYQLATSLTAIVKDIYDHDVMLANQFDPRYASGIYQDAIGELYFMTRKLATHSIAPLTFEGLNGVVIPQGYQVRDTAGNVWETTGTYNINNTGRVTGNVMCTTAGAIEANPNSITNIISGLSGLDRVYNEDSAIAGYNEESRSDFEIRRSESVSVGAKMTDDAVRAAVLNIPDVVDCYVISNPTDATVEKGATNYPLIRNSIVVSVVGGKDYDVAEAAFIKGGTGCSWNGNTPVTVYDNNYVGNKPSYPISILRPDFLDVYFQITVIDVDALTLDKQNEVKQYIIDSSKSGINKVRIGKTLIPAVYVFGLQDIGIISIKVSLDNETWTDTLPIGIDQFPSIDEFRISIRGI